MLDFFSLHATVLLNGGECGQILAAKVWIWRCVDLLMGSTEEQLNTIISKVDRFI